MSTISEIVYNNLKHSDDKWIDATNIVEDLFKNEIYSINECIELNHFVKTIARKFFKTCAITFCVTRVGDCYVTVDRVIVYSSFDGDEYDFKIDLTNPINVYTYEDIPKNTDVMRIYISEDSGYDIEFE